MYPMGVSHHDVALSTYPISVVSHCHITPKYPISVSHCVQRSSNYPIKISHCKLSHCCISLRYPMGSMSWRYVMVTMLKPSTPMYVIKVSHDKYVMVVSHKGIPWRRDVCHDGIPWCNSSRPRQVRVMDCRNDSFTLLYSNTGAPKEQTKPPQRNRKETPPGYPLASYYPRQLRVQWLRVIPTSYEYVGESTPPARLSILVEYVKYIMKTIQHTSE